MSAYPTFACNYDGCDELVMDDEVIMIDGLPYSKACAAKMRRERRSAAKTSENLKEGSQP